MLAAAAFALHLLGAPITLGVIAVIVAQEHGDWQSRGPARLLVPIATIVSLAAATIVPVQIFRGLFAIGLVLTCARPGIRRPIPLFLGGVSYPLYLNHWAGAFVGHGLTKHLARLPAFSFIPIVYGASLIIGAIAYCLVDRPVLARRQGWFTPARGCALGATAYTLVAVGLVGGLMIG